MHKRNTLFRNNLVAIDFGKDLPKHSRVKPVNFAYLRSLFVLNKVSNINLFQKFCCQRVMLLRKTA